MGISRGVQGEQMLLPWILEVYLDMLRFCPILMLDSLLQSAYCL